ncbi:hypothetical protein I79_014604 [Cricetulus griseus]|uniref:Uncharacterized protein n=1 Tax=Cricetulus griseus TaxID=10029 RepID=G3HUJ3_CRIGR|nr:hypothetical protein I79_014604 [Cricetulus griseus]
MPNKKTRKSETRSPSPMRVPKALELQGLLHPKLVMCRSRHTVLVTFLFECENLETDFRSLIFASTLKESHDLWGESVNCPP